jgi:hypothetical protein
VKHAEGLNVNGHYCDEADRYCSEELKPGAEGYLGYENLVLILAESIKICKANLLWEWLDLKGLLSSVSVCL